jgi:hypothetical protein
MKDTLRFGVWVKSASSLKNSILLRTLTDILNEEGLFKCYLVQIFVSNSVDEKLIFQ